MSPEPAAPVTVRSWRHPFRRGALLPRRALRVRSWWGRDAATMCAVTEARQRDPGARRRRVTARWRSWGIVTKVVTAVLAVCTALATIAGGVEALTGWISAAKERFDEPPDFLRTPRLGLQVWQGGEQVDLTDGSTGGEPLVVVALEAEPFELWMSDQLATEGLALCAWTDDVVFELTGGQHRDETQCLASGHGMADDEYASGRLYLDPENFNYLIGQRLQGTSDDGLQRAYFARTHWAVEDERADDVAPIGEDGGSLYLTAWSDRNQDDVVDGGEFEFLRLDF